MKSWQSILFGIFVGLGFAAILNIITAAPHGTAIELVPAPTQAPVIIHVSGAVQQPGVYELPTGCRLQEAVEAAGGFSAKANAAAVNLAARIKDGDKVVIPEIGQPTPDAPPVQVAEPEPPAQQEPSSPGAAPAGLVNINTASMEELMSLPGIGETRAKDIIAYREAHGGFQTVEELDAVKGIGPATFAGLKDLVTVE